MKKIDFFIAGAAKSGTTALYNILKQHKDIFLPEFKEPHFFASDLEKYKAHKSKSEYFKLYNDQGDKIWGDASIFNMYSNVAIKNIIKHNENAKIIIMLRKQTATVPSFHSQLLFTQDETEKNIEKAWDFNEKRLQGINIPKSCKCSKILDYKNIFKYAEQLESIYSIVPSENIHIVLHEDFVQNNSNELFKIINFLGVRNENLKNIISNENEVNIFPIVSRILRHPPSVLKKTKRILIGDKGNKLYKKILEYNSIVRAREPLSDKMKMKILEEYVYDISKLELLLNRDLSIWKK